MSPIPDTVAGTAKKSQINAAMLCFCPDRIFSERYPRKNPIKVKKVAPMDPNTMLFVIPFLAKRKAS
jgi:hypothetical protein